MAYAFVLHVCTSTLLPPSAPTTTTKPSPSQYTKSGLVLSSSLPLFLSSSLPMVHRVRKSSLLAPIRTHASVCLLACCFIATHCSCTSTVFAPLHPRLPGLASTVFAPLHPCLPGLAVFDFLLFSYFIQPNQALTQFTSPPPSPPPPPL